MPESILVCDIVEHGLDCFGKKPQTWRVTHHMKRVEDTLDSELANEALEPASRIYLEMVREWREEERAERIAKGWPAMRRYRLLYCTPDEATHVSLTGICGGLAPINQCKRLGVVPWTPERIEEERANAVSDFWLKNEFAAHWEWE